MATHTITLGGSTVSLTLSLEAYQAAWKAFIVVHHLDVLESLAIATTLSWKVADKSAVYANLEAVGERAEQLHIGTVDNRFIASIALQEPYEAMWIIKILERRSGASDRLGLDSIDYIVHDLSHVEEILKNAGAHVERQKNELHEWLSLRFGKNLEFEAKFVDRLIFDISILELKQANKRISSALNWVQ